jgi:hypothetical protein
MLLELWGGPGRGVRRYVRIALARMGADARAYMKKRRERSGLDVMQYRLVAEGSGVALGDDFLGVLSQLLGLRQKVEGLENLGIGLRFYS